ncbi:sugar ABC transporter ATP-binding protein, partial [Pseudomonas sp. BGM005]|nr:sugar ABC transporter ATP-binding protein [Pseudomonas sp. BG5]
IDAGLAYVTEDRKQLGLVLNDTILHNTTLVNLKAVSNASVIDSVKESRVATDYRSKLRIRSSSIFQETVNLSGGNQQKVLIGRWLLTHPKILILDEPTRGIDVGAKAEIHRLVTDMARNGVAVIMISSEMPEVLGMSDRIMVMHEGRVTGFLNRDEATQIKVMELAAQ